MKKTLALVLLVCMALAISSCGGFQIGSAQPVEAFAASLPAPGDMVCAQYIAVDGGSLLLYQPDSTSIGGGVIYEWADDGGIRKLKIDKSLRRMARHEKGALLWDEDWKIWLLEKSGERYTISSLQMPYKESVRIDTYNGDENIIITRKWKAYRLLSSDEIEEFPLAEDVSSTTTNAFTERVVFRGDNDSCLLYLPDGTSHKIMEGDYPFLDRGGATIVVTRDAQYVGSDKGAFVVTDAGIAEPLIIGGTQVENGHFAGAGEYALFMDHNRDIYLQKNGGLQQCTSQAAMPADLSPHNTVVFRGDTYYPDEELKYAVWEVYTAKGAGMYSDGSAATQQVKTVYVINLQTGQILSEQSEAGGIPAGYVGSGGGSRTGSAPGRMSIRELFETYFVRDLPNGSERMMEASQILLFLGGFSL